MVFQKTRCGSRQVDGRDGCFLMCVRSCSWPTGGGGRGRGAEPGLGRGLKQAARPLREQKGSLWGESGAG